MALTVFVRNVQDLSDDGGCKFKFRCDRGGSGVESQYVASKNNLLTTAVLASSVFVVPDGVPSARTRAGCDATLSPSARFRGECGTRPWLGVCLGFLLFVTWLRAGATGGFF